MKKIFIISFAALLASAAAFAQDGSESVAMGFCAVPRDIRSASMGGTSMMDNVAVRPFESTKLDIQASYAMYAPKSNSSSNIDFSVYGKIAGRLGLKGFFSYDAGQAYTPVDASGVASKTSYTPSDMLAGAGVSYAIINNKLSAGATFKYMSSNLAKDALYSAVAFDVLLAGHFGDFKVVAGATSLGGKVTTAGGSYDLPSAVVVGGDWSRVFGGKHSIDAALELNYFFKGGLRAGFGAEYGFKDMLFVRAGYNYGGKTVLPSYASVGIAGKFKGIKLGVSMLLGDTLNGTMQFGLGWMF